MSRPFISALIDTCDHEEFIGDAIDSVLEQDFPASELEILVVDDGSSDTTGEIVRKFQPRVRYMRKTNGGQGSAFNVGIAEARGEIIAFLDGDDWWAPGKLDAIATAFDSEPATGLVGHGITSVYPDRSRLVQVPRETLRFRVNSVERAKTFRMCRGFLGTSRMSYRRHILNQIGFVPEALRFEADEYLFTLAGFFADVLILKESLTFYRLHDKNLYQLSDGDQASARRKYEVIAALSRVLRDRLTELGVPEAIARTTLECVSVEAQQLRLILDSGFPWETVATEMKIMQVFHSDASPWQRAFSCARLIPALVMPASSYYRWRQRFTTSAFYRRLRRKFLPFPTPRHVNTTKEEAN